MILGMALYAKYSKKTKTNRKGKREQPQKCGCFLLCGETVLYVAFRIRESCETILKNIKKVIDKRNRMVYYIINQRGHKPENKRSKNYEAI